MKNIHMHSVTVKNKSLEILSADTDFYLYMGQERFYASFDMLIHQDYREEFFSRIKNRDTSAFVVNMVNLDNKAMMTYMHIVYGTDTMYIELEGVEELKEGQELYRNMHDLKCELLGLHNDTIFTYNDSSKEVKLYTPDFGRCIRVYSLQEFIDDIKSNIEEEDYETLNNLVVSLKSESGSFVYNFKGNILSISKECKVSIVKGIATKKTDAFDIAGYIHRGSTKANSSYAVEKDALTGTYSKREIANIVRKTIEIEKQTNVAICILDIDYFKRVNDNFGHMMGDEILKSVADIILTEVGNSGIVGRFGGDEFFVMFYGVDDMEKYREKLRGIKNRVNTQYPGNADGTAVRVTLSIGCAVYPKDAQTYDDLFSLADYCLYLAKDKGRNRYVIYKQNLHGSLEEIKDYFTNNRRVDARKDLAMGDVLCMIGDKHHDDAEYTPEMLVDDLVENLPIDRILCLSGNPLKLRCMSGISMSSADVIENCFNALQTSDFGERFENDVYVVDDIERIHGISEAAYQAYADMNVKSFILVRFKDAVGKDSMLALEMITNHIAWNLNCMYNYRTIARMFSKYEL